MQTGRAAEGAGRDKLLGKIGKRFWIPGSAVGRSLNAHVQGFLFDNITDIQIQQKYAVARAADVDCRSIALSVDHSFFRDKKGVKHGGIVANTSSYIGYLEPVRRTEDTCSLGNKLQFPKIRRYKETSDETRSIRLRDSVRRSASDNQLGLRT